MGQLIGTPNACETKHNNETLVALGQAGGARAGGGKLGCGKMQSSSYKSLLVRANSLLQDKRR